MRSPLLLAVLVSVIVGPSIVGGSVVGAQLSRSGLFIGAIAGGVVAVCVAALVAARIGLIARDTRRRTAVGGVVGFAIASSLFFLSLLLDLDLGPLDTPLVPALSGLLVPIGAVLGSRIKSRHP